MTPKKRRAREDPDADYHVPLNKKTKTFSNAAPFVPSTRITRFMTLENARSNVLGTTEILENILSYLPPKDIFVLQRVSKTWKDNIAKSTSIQEKLFLRLRHSNEARAVWALMKDGKLTKALFSPIKVLPSRIFPDHPFRDATQRLYTSVSVNPFLSLRQREMPIGHGIRNYLEQATLKLNSRFKLHSSLMDTYITDPPSCATNIVFSYSSQKSPRQLRVSVRVTGPAGPTTIGDVYRTLAHQKNEDIVSIVDDAEDPDMFRVHEGRDETVQGVVGALQQKYKTEYILNNNKISFLLRGSNMYAGPHPIVASAYETDWVTAMPG